ncbi:MAG: DNA replication/repair protein RecF, partial [Chitinophagaceae bacterium]
VEKGTDMELLSVFDTQLNERGHKIFEKRKNIFPALKDKVNKLYHEISQSEEIINLHYQSALFDCSLHKILHQNRQRDILLQRTTDGIHRDDMIFSLNGYPFKQTASQGQRKNFLFALKLAQYDLLQTSKKISPLLLLDDIFEKLDHHRISNLISFISKPGFGQVFITDTEEERIKKIWGRTTDQLQFITL